MTEDIPVGGAGALLRLPDGDAGALVPVAFTWPSAGRLTGTRKDVVAVAWGAAAGLPPADGVSDQQPATR